MRENFCSQPLLFATLSAKGSFTSGQFGHLLLAVPYKPLQCSKQIVPSADFCAKRCSGNHVCFSLLKGRALTDLNLYFGMCVRRYEAVGHVLHCLGVCEIFDFFTAHFQDFFAAALVDPHVTDTP
jgi:hypothetical protein